MNESGKFEERPKSGKDISQEVRKKQEEKGFKVIEGGGNAVEDTQKPDTLHFRDLDGKQIETRSSILGHDYLGPADDSELRNLPHDLSEK